MQNVESLSLKRVCSGVKHYTSWGPHPTLSGETTPLWGDSLRGIPIFWGNTSFLNITFWGDKTNHCKTSERVFLDNQLLTFKQIVFQGKVTINGYSRSVEKRWPLYFSEHLTKLSADNLLLLTKQKLKLSIKPSLKNGKLFHSSRFLNKIRSSEAVSTQTTVHCSVGKQHIRDSHSQG